MVDICKMISLRNSLAFGFFLLITSQLIFSTAVADRPVYQHIGIDRCGSSPSVFAGAWYRDQCTIGDVNCSTVTCNLDFMKSMKMKVKWKISKCDDPARLTVTIDVTELNITWSHTYAKYEKVEVPGFTGVTSPPVKVTVGAGLTQDSISITAYALKQGKQALMIRINAKSSEGGDSLMSAKIETVLPVNTKACVADPVYQEVGFVRCGSSPSAVANGRWYRDQCSVDDVNCSTGTCNLDFIKSMKMRVKWKVNQCDDPVSLTVTIDVTELNITWSHTYADYEKLEVPGFTGVNVSVGAGITQNSFSLTAIDVKEGKHHTMIRINAKSAEGGDSLMVAKMSTVVPVNTKDCEVAHVSWFKRQSDGVKAAVIISPILFLSLVAIGLGYYCKKKRRAPSVVTVNVPPPSYDEATVNYSKVPMQPLINE